MTRAELMDMIKHLKWTRAETNGGLVALRCERGDCPIIAAYKIKFPDGRYLGNHAWAEAALVLGLPQDEALDIVREADYQIIPELELTMTTKLILFDELIDVGDGSFMVLKRRASGKDIVYDNSSITIDGRYWGFVRNVKIAPAETQPRG